ncbi:MAG: hypothetical protein PHP28_00520 [Actinomycetota bacterium]|nr:hypothetical protein [Actinomycetota bacterium]MDD5666578.1 hypothetical protein [Actinomycetota bacterium]
MWGWTIAYFAVLLTLYRFLVFDYVTNVLDNQLLGLTDTLALTAVLFCYLLLCAAPPFLWSRRGRYHPIWRGMESFACYLLVALILGAVFAASSGGEWSTLSGIAPSGAVWSRIGSVAVMLAVFFIASWWGGKTAPGRNARSRRSSRRKGDSA